MIKLLTLALQIVIVFNCAAQDRTKINILDNKSKKMIDILVDGKLFTSYIYSDTIPVLKKTVLYPIIAANGAEVTRSYPLQLKSGERVDHPHHIGSWFNYGYVNGLDFWNNSDAIPPDRKKEMGTIKHDEIISIKSGDLQAELVVSANWLKPDGSIILKEKTKFIFHAGNNKRIIDRIVTLTAPDEPVSFKDNKEGLIAIRVARQLEHPSDKPVVLSDAKGLQTEVPILDNKNITGHYINSEGVEGEDVWGKRAKWVLLSGAVDDKNVTIALFDHPDNIGYPTYWHARGYGLFAANPLGHEIFTEGKTALNFSLNKNESVTFKYRILIVNGQQKTDFIEKEFKNYESSNFQN